MNMQIAAFRKPSAIEAILNKVFGWVVGLGLGPSASYLLQVRGRKSGRLFSTPVNLLEMQGKKYLVAPRGRTQWVRNAEAAGEVTLKKGNYRQSFRLRALPEGERPALLKAYLDRFRGEVQRYFPVRAGSDVKDFAAIAEGYPVFEITNAD
jgi:deazaflavin-dependent oxidoreductase (nitroreductase family)